MVNQLSYTFPVVEMASGLIGITMKMIAIVIFSIVGLNSPISIVGLL